MTGERTDTVNLSDDRRYQELVAHIRFTDDISFKLLSLVPLVSGGGIVVAWAKFEAKPSALLYVLSLFAAAITTALFAWERRNIQICQWCRTRAARMEERVSGPTVRGVLEPGHFYRFPAAPAGIGKTEAERCVYSVAVFAWLLLPWMMGMGTANLAGGAVAILRVAYAPAAVLIGAVALVLCVAPIPTIPADVPDV